MSDILRIAVISDLHCRKSGEPMRTTYLYSDLLGKPVHQNPVTSLKDLFENELSDYSADILLCPGDISDRMEVQGLVSGWKYLEEAKRFLKAKYLITTVGNHDVNSHGLLSESYNYHVQNLDSSYPINNNEDLASRFWSSYHFFIFQTTEFLILTFDSCFDHVNKDKAKMSEITDTILEKMENEIKKIKDDSLVKIALLHHHPKPFSNIASLYKDGDVLERGDRFLDLLDRYGFDLVIHGHKHIPRLDHFDGNLPVFCAGSFSSRMNVSEWPQCNNTFHIIEIDKKSKSESSKAKGIVKTWEYAFSAGWKMSRNIDACFPAFTGFGNLNRDMSMLASRIGLWFRRVTDPLKEVVSYQKVIDEFPEINHLTPNEQRALMDFLKRLKLEFTFPLGIGPKKLSVITEE